MVEEWRVVLETETSSINCNLDHLRRAELQIDRGKEGEIRKLDQRVNFLRAIMALASISSTP